MPLLFLITTLLAKFLFLLHITNQATCILISVRLIDSFLPPLAAIPVFLIAKELVGSYDKTKVITYLIVAFSILNFTPLFVFSFQLQKNALATVFIFSYLYYVVKILKYKTKNDIIKSLLFLIICMLTHFGSFGLLVFLSLSIFLVWFSTQKNKWNTYTLKVFLGLVLAVIIVLLFIAIVDYTRFIRIINLPIKIFEAPVLLFALNSQNFILKGQTLIILIGSNLLAIFGFVFILRNKKQFDNYKFVLAFSMCISILFLSNPLLGLEWASRLFMLAYIPLVILYLIVYNSTCNNIIKIPTIIIFSILLFISIGSSTFDKPFRSINDSSFNELQQLKNKNLFTKNDAIVARQSLRILSNWVLETKGVDKYLLSKDEYKKYPSVYLLKQINGKNLMLRGSEPNFGSSQKLIWKGDYFEVYKIINDFDLPYKPQKIFKGVIGTIYSFSENKILVKDNKTNKIRTVYYNNRDTSFANLNNGNKVEINGEWMPFSLSINAETIKNLEKFEE